LPAIATVLQAHHFQSIELKSKVKYIPLPVNMQTLDEIKIMMIQNALKLNEGKKVAAAELLGITRQTLDNLILRLKIDIKKPKPKDSDLEQNQ
jgi:DNA-binding NtrC family response regulator